MAAPTITQYLNALKLLENTTAMSNPSRITFQHRSQICGTIPCEEISLSVRVNVMQADWNLHWIWGYSLVNTNTPVFDMKKTNTNLLDQCVWNCFFFYLGGRGYGKWQFQPHKSIIYRIPQKHTRRVGPCSPPPHHCCCCWPGWNLASHESSHLYVLIPPQDCHNPCYWVHSRKTTCLRPRVTVISEAARQSHWAAQT